MIRSLLETTSTELSHVANLSLEKREDDQAFLNDGEIHHLQIFSPEEMLLILIELVGTSYGCMICND
ncbi:hypothetical protein CD31_21505 [Lysinibacillus boronitolerans JCM 21713 = 10a = NBRC 103108]|uniref:Uncharacterized protein n=1 Tax=Lysinibacillus boronitolerans JCM 21713 = 10a = NBRC 103108 TaxID=1294264 RepID=A0ABR4XUR5_9BACI|nr:hypothetical protein CD31_21505 [Lysinibacillus boronitolerans JCM 21713 = 10a = NBRC 103108]